MKTKILIPLALFVFFVPLLLSAQDCYVVMKIKGTIILEGTGHALLKDDQICGNDNVIFKSADAVAIVHSESKGRYTLKVSKSRISELENVLKSSVLAALSKSKNSLDTRSETEPLSEVLWDVYCVIGKYLIDTEEDKYSVNDNDYFTIRFIYNDSPYEIKLANEVNNIIIDKEIIKTQTAINKLPDFLEDVALYYYNSRNSDKPQIINTFDLTFPDEKILVDELSSYVMMLRTSGKSEETIQDELVQYMFNSYGKINKEPFLLWLNKEVMQKK